LNKISQGVPLIQNQSFNNRINSYSNNKESNFRILSQETKINELETKLILLEQNNQFFLDQIKNYERNFEIQIAKFSQITENERENRQKVEKIFTIFSDQTNFNTSELKNKVNFIQEIFEKEEKLKYEQRQKDFEVYKNIINTINDKITETVKAEVDMRFKADIENKIFTQNIGNKLTREMDFIRREIDEQSKENKDMTREYSRECSERTVNLSRYVDQMIVKVSEEPQKNFEKLKSSFNKLTEQVKNNMQFQSDFNKIIEEKVNLMSESNIKEKDKKITDFTDLEKRTDKRLKDTVFYMENIFKQNSAALNDRIDNLSSNTDKNLNFITSQLIDTRKKLIMKIHENEEKSQKEFISIVEDLEQIVLRIANYELLLNEYDIINSETKSKLNRGLAEFQSKYETRFINEKMQRELENEDLKDIIAKSNNDIIELGEITNNQLEAITKNFDKENNNLIYKFNQISDRLDETNKNNYKIFQGLEINIQKIINNNLKEDVENLMNNMLNEFDARDKFNIYKDEMNKKIKISENNINIELDKIDKITAEQIDSIRQSMQNGFDSVYEKFNIDFEEKIKLIEIKLDNLKLKDKESNNKNYYNENINSVDISENPGSKKLINNEEFKGIIEQIKSEIKDISEKFDDLQELNLSENKIIKEKFDEIDKDLTIKKYIKTEIQMKNKIDSLAEYEAKNTLERVLVKLEIENTQKYLENKFLEKETEKNTFEEKLNSFIKDVEEVRNLYNVIGGKTEKVKEEYLEAMESKVEKILEKIKKDNMDLWNIAVQEMGKYNGLEGTF